MNQQSINEYAIRFVENKKNYRRNDKQLKVISKLFKSPEYIIFCDQLTKDKSEFIEIIRELEDDSLLSCVEYDYKNDGFSIREKIILSPKSYIIYTCIVFNIAYQYHKIYKEITSIGETVFYAGHISFNDKSIKNDCTYVQSYNRFKNILQGFEGSRVIKSDCSSFFDTISVVRLVATLESLGIDKNLTSALSTFFSIHNFTTLPQVAFSTSSSFLSQVYMHELDVSLKKYFISNTVEYTRYVDDIYIKVPDNFEERKITEIKDILQGLYTREGLKLSGQKTEVMDRDRFSAFVNSGEIPESILHRYQNSEEISEKAQNIVKNECLTLMFEELHEAYALEGARKSRYQEIKKSYGIDEDFSKIINNVEFEKLYKNYSREEFDRILRCHNSVMFNPSILFSLYISMVRFYEKKYSIKTEHIKKILYQIYTNNNQNIRYIICACNYLSQNDSINLEVLEYIGEYNSEYKLFIDKYLGQGGTK